MGICFNFESQYREDRDVLVLYFKTEDHTEWRMAEKWRTKTGVPGSNQIITFKKLNNFLNHFDIQLEILSLNHGAASAIRRFRRAKPCKTLFRTSLLHLQKLYSSSLTKGTDEWNPQSMVLTDVFRCKVTIRKAYELLRVPWIDNWIIFSDQMCSLIRSKIFADSELMTNGRFIDIHKCIFAIRLPVIHATIVASHKNKNLNPQRFVFYIDNIDDKNLKVALNYIYGGRLEPIHNLEQVASLCGVACMYKMEHLKELCHFIIRPNLDSSNVVAILRKACRWQDYDLQTICKSYITEFLDSVERIDQNFKIVQRELSRNRRERYRNVRRRVRDYGGSPDLPPAKRRHYLN